MSPVPKTLAGAFTDSPRERVLDSFIYVLAACEALTAEDLPEVFAVRLRQLAGSPEAFEPDEALVQRLTAWLASDGDGRASRALALLGTPKILATPQVQRGNWLEILALRGEGGRSRSRRRSQRPAG